LTRTARFLFFVLLSGTQMSALRLVAAETPDGAAANHEIASNPVAEVRDAKSWEFGPFVNYGNGFGNRDDYRFLWAGVQGGKALTPVVHAGIFSGQFEFGSNIMPLWQAYTPPPHLQESPCVVDGQDTDCLLAFGGGTFRGVSITPVIFRWNFLTRSRRFQPWFQAAGGVIYTTHKFPPNLLSTPTIDGGTCVWNFSPQGGGGFHYFTRSRRSIDIGVNGVHISSASLGDRNPGVNASIQVQVGYTFWK
jgi:lipid A 3-O-deacylase